MSSQEGRPMARRGRLQPEFSFTARLERYATPAGNFSDKGQINTGVLGDEATSDWVTSVLKKTPCSGTEWPLRRLAADKHTFWMRAAGNTAVFEDRRGRKARLM